MSLVWNPKSGLVKETGKKYKILTVHCLEKNLKEFTKKLNIEGIKPIREKKGDILKDIELLNMPEYKNEDIPLQVNPYYKFTIMSDEDRTELSRLLNIKITSTTRCIWYPERPEHRLKNMMYITDEIVQPTFRIYIVSKGRSETRLTVKTLEEMGVDYQIVIEPQEFEDYNKYIHKDKILILPKEYLNKNQGSIPARNFIWQHSMDNNQKYHWVLDDNIEGFFRWNENKKLPFKSGLCFKLIEDYMMMYDNLAMCGIQYTSFYPEISMSRPLYLKNTRIYSCILIKNDIEIEERWRGKYNEDTDLSLRLLKKGYSTLLFQNFLCGKKTTLSVKGGNQDIYSGDGLQNKLDSLIEQHPDCVKGTVKFKKVHHQVDYSQFKDNKLIFKKKIIKPDYPQIRLIRNPTKEKDEISTEEDDIDNNTIEDKREDKYDFLIEYINDNIIEGKEELKHMIQFYKLRTTV
jgi:hypothetical protein